MESIELIKTFSAIPIGGILAFFLWRLIQLVSKMVENHLHTLQQNTEIIKDGIKDLHGSAEKTIDHLEQQTNLLQKLVDK